MKRKSVGYFEGTDSAVLTSLVCQGYDTLPISNGLDNHGMHVRLLNEESKVEVLVGYLHKIIGPEGVETRVEDMFHICHTYQIPFLIVVPGNLHECARAKFEVCPEVVQFVDPSDLHSAIRTILKESDE